MLLFCWKETECLYSMVSGFFLSNNRWHVFATTFNNFVTATDKGCDRCCCCHCFSVCFCLASSCCHSCCICVCLARSAHNTTFGLVSIDIFFGCNIDEEDSLVFPTDIWSISICLWTRDNIDIQKQITTKIREMLKTQTPYTYLCSFQTCEH